MKQIPLPLGIPSQPSLENFVAGLNQEAKATISNIAKGIGERVVFLWGAKGTGKSHLLEASCQEANRQSRTAVHLFPTEIPHSMEENFLALIQKSHLICIDDIDTLAKDREREEILFHLYNLAETSKTRLLFAGTQNPLGTGFSLPDLGSRLAAGLVLRLRLLDDDDKCVALKCRAQERGFTIPDQVLAFLLHHYQRDMHSLFEFLDRIDEQTLIEKRLVTIPLVRKLLSEFPITSTSPKNQQ